MSARLKRNALCLCLLAKAEHGLARTIIEKGNENLVRNLLECSHNILKGNVPLKKGQKRRLSVQRGPANVGTKEVCFIRKETYSIERWFR